MILPPTSDSEANAVTVKDWEIGRMQDEIVSSQGIRIRRRPPTGPPLHYVGPFEFRLQNEGNTPRNILEEIVWHKHTEVSKVLLDLTFFSFFLDWEWITIFFIHPY